jgi:hypothetical protein
MIIDIKDYFWVLMSGSPKKKAPMCIQADLQKHVKKTGKKAAAKKA